MNSLETHLQLKKLNEIASMNALHGAGIISDNCVMAWDVAEADCTAAIAFLTFQGIKSKAPSPSPVQNELSFPRQPHNDP